MRGCRPSGPEATDNTDRNLASMDVGCFATTSTTAWRSTSRNSSVGSGVSPSAPTGRFELASISAGLRGREPAWVVRISVMP